MKKKLLPICAMALLTVGYSSVASASTGTVTKEEAAQIQQDIAKKEAAIQAQQKNDTEKKQVAQAQEKNEVAKKQAVQAQEKNEVAKKQAAQVQEKSNMAKEVVAPQVKEKEAIAKKEAAKEAGEKLPNTASNNVAMMALSACLVGIGTLFGLKRRNKVKA
ncbi:MULTISPECIES: LPXTG cell wall anchor domain-containing protein [Bacillus cereus group]|uniref:LPXTG cell wall anchor domain protein n=2 Tax=Bacillus cereus TaxID=1396 RepID=A0AAN0W5Y5_BACCE|nr:MULTISPECIES: LPXTG cell wall anchor domain-containing protein [Bacillus cereus group]ABK87586.1 cell wall surface anchor family protein [Bacillus thuringiensis str. Al Hakam]ACO26869.1 cell wall surface anchor family protein [Bacillus cereus 03BB102]AJG52398.1 LPXTG cell wall anchor domain protein [Bacillus cereus 03BB102]AJH68509.1 LPXTG cell wall anchor domain protein [Bacillus thuringiensis]AJI10273.1 LPXTG cell wall anchor domain protein [Bacillus cereus 03BB108]